MKKDDVLSEWNQSDEQVDKKSAKKLVWRTRLSISFTVLRTLLFIFLIYCLYMIPVSVYYDMSGKAAEFDRLVSTLVETRNPGIAVDKYGMRHSAEINPLLTQSTKATLYRNVGDYEVVVGEVTAKKWLFGSIRYKLDLNNKYLNEDSSSYIIAPDLLGKPISNDKSESELMIANQLEKIEDGYVAQARFSTRKGMSPQKLNELISEYDVTVHQMPVFGGETTEVEVSYGRAGQFTFAQTLMLRPFMEYDNKNRPSASYHSLTGEEAIESSVKQFYKDIEWLIENGNYQEQDIDKQRLAYIKANDFQVFGAMVTGPIREIERLLEEEMFHNFQLGGIEVWNWTEK
ncbi:anti sigma factor C-terminal domain-containing protein [Aquibacillus saliphilus]|uniref:anti sigma factor C-terminal domain-containing protein n=1 Tax=Aquibacillus saliphilus TaxID=1909422 RepID=UPI001CF01467|nr:anti sigma factor C-terminal domain-containing protein [Aquibacillus saliphilus]